MKAVNRNKVVAASLTTLLFAAVMGLLFMQHSNKSMSELLDEAKLKSERFLSEKLLLDKEMVGLKSQLSSALNKNGELGKLLASANDKIARKEKELKGIEWDKARSKKLEMELADILKLKGELENQIAALNRTIVQLRSQNEALTAESATVNGQYQALAANNELLKAISANNWRVDATRGKKDRLTVVARRTNRLAMGFDVPAKAVENVHFKITAPDGRIISNEQAGLTYRVIENPSSLLASVSAQTGEIEVTKRIEMTYKPTGKLDAGVYKIDIFDNDIYMSTCQVKLR